MESPKSDNKDANRIQRREAEIRRTTYFIDEEWVTFMVLNRRNKRETSAQAAAGKNALRFSPKDRKTSGLFGLFREMASCIRSLWLCHERLHRTDYQVGTPSRWGSL